MPDPFPTPEYIDACRKAAEEEIVECACGCGQRFPCKDKRGRSRQYVQGHNRPSKEGRRNLSLANKGKRLPLKTRQKISETLRGHFVSAETRRKQSEAMRGERNHRWRGGRKVSKEGYIYIYQPDHPHANNVGCVFEHILVLEKKLGRYLLLEEESHHINGIKDDNRPENLYAFPSHALHTAYHNRLRAFQEGRVPNYGASPC